MWRRKALAMHIKQIKKQSLYKTGLSISTYILLPFYNTFPFTWKSNKEKKELLPMQVNTVNISVIVNIKKNISV